METMSAIVRQGWSERIAAAKTYRFFHEPGSIRAIHAPSGQKVGSLDYEQQEEDPAGTGFVSSVSVRPDHRRRGVASGMADALRTSGITPTFAPRDSGDSLE